MALCHTGSCICSRDHPEDPHGRASAEVNDGTDGRRSPYPEILEQCKSGLGSPTTPSHVLSTTTDRGSLWDRRAERAAAAADRQNLIRVTPAEGGIDVKR
jgi:hypothetical protein